MHLKIKPALLTLLFFGVLPLILQVIPLVMMFSLFLTPILIVGYYFITRKLLKSGNFNILTAVVSSLIAAILSFNIGVVFYILGSVFWGKRAYSDITNILGIFSLSSFPISALIGSISTKLYFDIKTKTKIFKVENIFVLFFIVIGIIILGWNFKYLESIPAREQAKREAELQKINAVPYIELKDITFKQRGSNNPQNDLEEFRSQDLNFSLKLPSFLKANLGSNGKSDIFIFYKKPTNNNSFELFASITMYVDSRITNNFQTKDDAVASLIDYLKPKVKTLDWPIKISTNGESSKSLNNQELYFLVTEYSSPAQARNTPSKTLYVVKGTPTDGYEIWQTFISKGEPNNIEVVKRIIESMN